MNIRLLIVLIFLGIGNSAKAQGNDSTIMIPKTFTPEEFRNFQLPPLESLFESAKTNPRLEAIEAAIESAKIDVKQTKRDWLKFFSVHAGYNYGILGIYSDYETEINPLATTYTGSTQSSWQVGANFSMPIQQIFDHRSTVKKQKKIVENFEYTKEIAFYDIKKEIIELYAGIQYHLKMMETSASAVAINKAGYAVSKSEFINNKIKPETLIIGNNNLKRAEAEYENIISELHVLLLKLELITNTKLISK